MFKLQTEHLFIKIFKVVLFPNDLLAMTWFWYLL